MDQNIEKCDLIIIGASIAGNYLCYLLSETNLKITVIEEHEKIGLPFQCAGIVSQKLSKLVELPENIILNRVSRAKLATPSGKAMILSGKEIPFIIDRVALDCLFYEKTRNKENIKYFLGEKFKSFQYIKDKGNKSLLVVTSKRKFRARILIGCDGPLSSVGKAVGIKNNVIYASQIRVKGKFNQNEAGMYFDPRWKELFGWIVPEGNGVFRIGLAASKNVARKFKLFTKALKVDLSKKIDRQGGIIPYGMMNKLAFNNVLLLGDSACQVKATTGGGIIMLITSAKYAANCIIKCFKTNNFSKKFIRRNYERPCASTVGKQLKIHYIIRSMLENFTIKDYDKFFHIIKRGKIEHLISIYGDMDFPRELVLKLLKNVSIFTFLIKFTFTHPKIFIKLMKIF
jgi:geranylgeranyl reductase family protein